jgi:tetratricopeptide (TPR) repeat protein
MSYRSRFLRSSIVVVVLFSLMPQAAAVRAQDLVATESITGGGSAFVFRNGSKKPQASFGSAYAFLGEAAGGGAKARRTNAQIAAAAKKRRAALIAARKKAAIAAANKKIALSNTLTAKAEANLDNGETDLAITNYRAALVQNPRNKRASDGLSDALTEKGIAVAGDTNNEAAIVYFDEAVKLDNKNDVAYAKLGAIYDGKKQTDKAILNYEKALAIDPTLADLSATLGLAYIDAGQIDKADQCLAKAEAGGSDTADTRYLRGLVLYKQNKNPEALAAFDRVLELDSRNLMANYYRGQTLVRIGRNDAAVAAYKRSLEVDPKFTPASFELGVWYYNAGDYNNSAASYENVIRYEPSNAQAHANLASCYRQLGRYGDANAEYKIASETIKTPELYSEWGFCLGKTNEWDKSVARLNTAREMSPTAVDDSNLGWAYYNSGVAKREAKDEAGAKADLELGRAFLQKAVEKDPKLDAAYLNLGSTNNGLGDYQAAVTALNVAVSLRQNWVIAINQLGLGYRGLNDLANAVATFKRVVDLDGSNSFGLFNLGEAYNASGNKKEAKKINDKLRKLNPALASKLDNVLSGKVVIDAAKQKIENKIPKVPKIPF